MIGTRVTMPSPTPPSSSSTVVLIRMVPVVLETVDLETVDSLKMDLVTVDSIKMDLATMDSIKMDLATVDSVKMDLVMMGLVVELGRSTPLTGSAHAKEQPRYQAISIQHPMVMDNQRGVSRINRRWSQNPGPIGEVSTLGWLIGPWEIWMKFKVLTFPDNFSDWWLRYLLWTCPKMNVTRP